MKLRSVDDSRRRHVAAVEWAAGGKAAPVVAAAAPALAAAVDARAVVLVEGISDQVPLEVLAARRGRDLDAEGVAIVPIGGATTIGRFLAVLGPGGFDVGLAGLCDAAEEGAFRRGLERAGLGADLARADMERLGFFVCDADLEDELIRALGPRASSRSSTRRVTASFRTFQKQPAQQGRPLEAQLRRFMGTRGGRKIHYARVLVEALELDRVPVRWTVSSPACDAGGSPYALIPLLSVENRPIGTSSKDRRVGAVGSPAMRIAVVGAHLSGEPLNGQLTSRGAALVRTTRTAPVYRLVALPTAPPKPGLLRVGARAGGAGSVEVEVWELDAAGFGSFVDEIPAPLGIGRVLLEDGSDVAGCPAVDRCRGRAGHHPLRRMAGVPSRVARLTSCPSVQAGPIRVTLGGGRSGAGDPIGTVTAHRSSRLTKFVYVPSIVLTASGSASTSATVGTRGTLGTTRASTSSHTRTVIEASRASSVRSRNTVQAGNRPAARMIEPTTASTSSGWASTNAPAASYRSATNEPP